MHSKHNRKSRGSQLISFARDSYLERTSRPIYAIWYLLVFILLYEVGTFLSGTDALSVSLQASQRRVVTFVWVRDFLEYAGFSSRMSWMAPPFVVVVILLAFQITSRTRWKVRFSDFVVMTAECVLLSLPLIVLSLIINRPADVNWSAIQAQADAAVETVRPGGAGLWADIVTGIGAGIYEELVFRLILISVLMIALQDVLRLDREPAIIFSVLISSLLFSVHHHFFFANGRLETIDAFLWSKFIFRMLAGVYFAALYAVRGFGIAAGTHAFYDILAAVLNAAFFSAPEA